MAKKKETVVLEDIELKPQVIGTAYQKKSNLGRVIVIFAIFILAVFYINDISVFINDLLGKNTASTIAGGSSGNEQEPENPEEPTLPPEDEVVYNVFSNTLEIESNSLTLKNFNYANKTLTFEAVNDTEQTVNLTGRKFFLETYSEDKTLLDRFKIDIASVAKGSKEAYTLTVPSAFYYLIFTEKTVQDYPDFTLANDDYGRGSLTCKKDNETLTYSFENKELKTINHTISNSNVNDSGYNEDYQNKQNIVNNYKDVTGVTATFNGSNNGYTAVISIDLTKVDSTKLNNHYYYLLKEDPKVVDFEMTTYGFVCS